MGHLTVSELFDCHKVSLGLDWLVAREQGNARVGAQPVQFPSALVGHLNPVRRHAVQVLGRSEQGYLTHIEPAAAEALLEELFAAQPVCIIAADGLVAPAGLVARAEAASVPLLSARAPSHEVLDALQHLLVSRLAKRESVHGVFIDVLSVGVLLSGEPGVGKSELALELVSRGHRLIADDAPEFFLAAPGTVEGTCPRGIRDFMEVRGLGIVNVRLLFGDSAIKQHRRLRLIVALRVMDPGSLSPAERLQGIQRTRNILGVDIPEITLPVAPGHNLAVLIECIVRNHILRMKGYDPLEEFEARRGHILDAAR